MSPLVSIVIPIYNAEKYIQQTIDSVFKQSFEDWELILVNDGSTDNTNEILNQLAIQWPNKISVLHKNNSGVADTRNIGMAKAKGKYIALLDADDFWLPENLEKKVSLLEKNEADFVYSDMYNVNENLEYPTLAALGKDDNILQDLLSWNGEVIPGPSSNLVFKSTCLKKNIQFSKLLSTIADQHFTVQLAFYFKGKRINEALWYYRNLPQSMSKSVALLEKDALNAYLLYLKNNYFNSKKNRLNCYSKMYLILAGSFWKDAKNYGRGLDYLFKSFFISPLFFTQTIIAKISEKK